MVQYNSLWLAANRKSVLKGVRTFGTCWIAARMGKNGSRRGSEEEERLTHPAMITVLEQAERRRLEFRLYDWSSFVRDA